MAAISTVAIKCDIFGHEDLAHLTLVRDKNLGRRRFPLQLAQRLKPPGVLKSYSGLSIAALRGVERFQAQPKWDMSGQIGNVG